MNLLLSEKMSEQIGWFLKFGIPKKKLTNMDLHYRGFEIIDRPVFFLSTGRTGTQWFNMLLNKDKAIKSFHEPVPSLFNQWKLSFKERQKILERSEPQFDYFREMFIVAREEYFRYAYKTGKRFAETNNYVTFFAPVIAELIPSAIFVHLYRHPGEFVRSGLRREWYGEGKSNIVKPHPESNGNDMPATQAGKIAWLWTQTNMFIEDFKSKVDPDRIHAFNFNHLITENIVELVNFIGAEINSRTIEKLIGKKVNVQAKGEIKEYSEWEEGQKQEIRQYCGELAVKYGYDLS